MPTPSPVQSVQSVATVPASAGGLHVSIGVTGAAIVALEGAGRGEVEPAGTYSVELRDSTLDFITYTAERTEYERALRDLLSDGGRQLPLVEDRVAS